MSVVAEQADAFRTIAEELGFDVMDPEPTDPQEVIDAVAQIRAQLVEIQKQAFMDAAYHITEGDKAGWWDSMADSSAVEYGDWLVDAGVFERHPEGCGRRWFYRPIEQKVTNP